MLILFELCKGVSIESTKGINYGVSIIVLNGAKGFTLLIYSYLNEIDTDLNVGSLKGVSTDVIVQVILRLVLNGVKILILTFLFGRFKGAIIILILI